MAIDFPASPSVNDTYTVNGVVYTWDGTKWTAVTPAGDKIVEGNTNAEVIDTGSDGRFVVTTEGVEALRVDSSQRVGIGTSTPSFVSGYTGLQVDGGSNGPVVKLTNSATGSTSADGFDIILQQGGSDAYIWQRESAPLVFGTASTERFRCDSSGRLLVGTSSSSGNYLLEVNGAIKDSAGPVRSVPQNSQTSGYTLVASDTGKHISITTGGVTVPASVFSVGDVISIYNNSGSNQTITQGASTTLRQAGTANTGNRTLAQYGVATVLCVASNTFVISGAGLS